MKTAKAVTAPLAVLCLFSTSHAFTWNVPSQECPSIQTGIDRAAPGDTVQVKWGTYHEHDIRLKSGVYLRSETRQPDCVIIDADSLGWVFYCEKVDSTATIEGFTITGGWDVYGGGMYCKDYSSPVLMDCAFTGNSAAYGAAMYSRNHSHPRLVRCTFSENSATCGGGILCYSEHSSPILTDCVFLDDSDADGHRPMNCRSYASPSEEDVVLAFASSGEPMRGGLARDEITCCDVGNRTSADWSGCIEAQFDMNDDSSATPVSCSMDTVSLSSADPSCGPEAAESNPGLIGAHGIECDVSSIGAPGEMIPETLFIGPAASNPLSPVTEISYGVPAAVDVADSTESSRVVINLYDQAGRRVRTLVDGIHPPGTYRVSWYCTDHMGIPLPDGTYFCRIICNGRTATRRIALSK